jgi:HPt (histidine-containing phosphotransfer) domain-containing protein
MDATVDKPSKPRGRRSSAARGAVYDVDIVLDTLGGDRGALRELSDMLFVDHERMLHDAEQALAARDLEQFGAIAHTLKGMVGNFAAPKTFSAAKKMYDAARAGDLEKSTKSFHRFKKEVTALVDALRNEPILHS